MKSPLLIIPILLLTIIGCGSTEETVSNRFPNTTDVKEYTTLQGNLIGFTFTSVIDDKPRRIYMNYSTRDTICLEGCGVGEVTTTSKTKEEVINNLTEEERKVLGL